MQDGRNGLREPVLVLNASYEPIHVTIARRAVVLILKGVATVEEETDKWLHSENMAIRIPSVIRLRQYRHIPRNTRPLSRKNIFLRDGYTCQYCQQVFPASQLTLDHVIPRSKGGPTSWENLVACCIECNKKKGDRTPEEAGMKLARQPRAYTLHTSRYLMRLMARKDSQWQKYLFF